MEASKVKEMDLKLYGNRLGASNLSSKGVRKIVVNLFYMYWDLEHFKSC